MENIIDTYAAESNTDFLMQYSKEENTDSEQILSNLSDEFIDEGKLNTNKNWYCLPYILSNKILTKQNNIKNVVSKELGDELFITVTYNDWFVKNHQEDFDSEKCEHYIDEDVLNTVSYTVPKDKQYICKLLIQKGITAMDTDFIEQYILN